MPFFVLAGYSRVGESDDLTSRLKAHRAETWKDAAATYLPVGDKTTARKIETSVIKALRKRGVPMKNANLH